MKKLKANTYAVLARAVEEGLDYGYRRAYKHTDTPSEDGLKEEIRLAIMNEICEVFEF